MRIRTKLGLGVGFLFSMIAIIMLVATVYLNRLSEDTKAILKDNSRTLQYDRSMMESLDDWMNQKLIAASATDSLSTKRIIDGFEQSLRQQENNITELGEKELTVQLRKSFESLKIENSYTLLNNLKKVLYQIDDLNLQAIRRKSEVAEKTAADAILYTGIFTTFCFLIGFSFIFNFPGYIANPIVELTRGVKEIADKNYSRRLHFSSNDEFGELANAFNVMAEKLDEYEHSALAMIMFEKKRIETIINNMHDAVIGFNEYGKMLFANTVACQLLNLDPTNILYQYGPDLALQNDLLRDVLKDSPEGKPLKIYADHKESYFSKEVYLIQIPHYQETDAGKVIILKNITPFKELDLAKTQFIATISHEIKTPVSGIKMCVSLLQDPRLGNINEEQQKLMDHITEEANRILKIVRELLDLAQLETGTLQMHVSSTRPRVLLDYAMQSLGSALLQKHISIEVVCPDDLPLVNIDLEKTTWVALNLLTNAIRFSKEHGKIVILVKQQGQEIIFSVRDFGKGIDPAYQGKVFDKFYRVPDDSIPLDGGAGLGLAISKDFIEAHGGRIWVESIRGEGADFKFSLPVGVNV